MKVLKEEGDMVFVQTYEPVLIVQILIGAWLLSVPASLIIGAINIWWFDIGVRGIVVFAVPMMLLGLATLDGTPCRKKWINKNDMQS